MIKTFHWETTCLSSAKTLCGHWKFPGNVRTSVELISPSCPPGERKLKSRAALSTSGTLDATINRKNRRELTRRRCSPGNEIRQLLTLSRDSSDFTGEDVIIYIARIIREQVLMKTRPRALLKQL